MDTAMSTHCVSFYGEMETQETVPELGSHNSPYVSDSKHNICLYSELWILPHRSFIK